MLDVSADQRFAKLLVERGKLRDADMTRALRVQEGQASRERLSRLIVRLGLISARDAADTLSEILDVPLVHGADYPEASVFDGQVSARFLKETWLCPSPNKMTGSLWQWPIHRTTMSRLHSLQHSIGRSCAGWARLRRSRRRSSASMAPAVAHGANLRTDESHR